MSEVDTQPRDEATGQFTSSEEKFGREAELEAAGWTPLVKKPETEDLTVEEALALTAPEPESEPVEIALYDQEKLAEDKVEFATDLEEGHEGPKIALTPETAAAALTTYREGQAAIEQALEDAKLLSEVGVEVTPAEEAAPKEEAALEEAKPEEATPPPVQESDPHAQALDFLEKNPAVRDLLASELQQAGRAQAQVAEQLNAAVSVAEQAFLNQFPEFRGVTDPGHAASIASSIQQQNPARWQAIVQAAAQTSQLVQTREAQHQQAMQAAEAQRVQEFRAYAAEQDAKFEQLVGKLSSEDVGAVRSYARDVLGLNDSDFAAMQTDRTVRDHRFQRAFLDAAKYHQIKQAPLKAVRPDAPRVQRPGVAPSRGAREAADLGTLSRKLDQTGHIDDALDLLRAQRKGR